MHNDHTEHERRLRAKHGKLRTIATSRVQERLQARSTLRQSKTLQKNVLFSKLKQSSINEILKFMEFHEYQVDTLCEENDEADRLFVLVGGSVQVTKTEGENETLIREYKAKDDNYPIFGESSILKEGKTLRNATLRTATGCTTMELSKVVYFKLLSSGDLMNENSSETTNINQSLRRQSSSYRKADAERLQKLKQIRETIQLRETMVGNGMSLSEEKKIDGKEKKEKETHESRTSSSVNFNNSDSGSDNWSDDE